mgnify:CR=1 FL=1
MKCRSHYLLFFYAFLILSAASCGSGNSEADESVSVHQQDSSGTDVVRKPLSGIVFYRASHILVPNTVSYSDSADLQEDPTYETALDIRRRIEDGRTTYEELFQRYSEDSTGIRAEELPSFTSGGVTEELTAAVRTLGSGEVSPVIVTRFGYHILKRLE